ncbi:carnitine O-acetyltransferase yat1 [Balamuthia mandrillaris]
MRKSVAFVGGSKLSAAGSVVAGRSSQMAKTSMRSFASGTAAVNYGNGPMWKNQRSMPRLPIPTLEETGKHYLDYLTPIVSKEELQRTTKLLEEFVAGEGKALQEDLQRLDKESPTSWLEGWWDTMYLTIRDPLPINVNPYFIFKEDPDRKSQPERAASLVEGFAKFLQLIREEKLEPDMERTTPLCMYQYSQLFGTTRIPVPGRDALRSYPSSRHIVVLSNNHFYKVDILDVNGQPISQASIASQLNHIASSSTKPTHALGVLTAGNRDHWASLRQSLLSHDSHNQASLQCVDSALFVLVLENNAPTSLQEAADVFLHGNARNRWFDKLQLIVCENGMSGVNMEHSPYDGHTLIRLATEGQAFARQSDASKQNNASSSSSNVQELSWHLPANVLRGMEEAGAVADDLIKNTKTTVLEFRDYGKKFITGNKFSPDGLVQMAFQLAYFRMKGQPASTYESAMTKRFLHGRTETLRSVTPQSLAFTQSFTSAKATPAEKEDSLRKAVEAHTARMNEAKNGQGVDRHWFALKNLAFHKQQRLPRYEIPALFLDPAYAKLSASVLSTSNCGTDSLDLFGFGPVVSDGLGLGYMIHNDAIPITVSSFQNENQAYASHLRQSFLDIQSLLQRNK